MAHHPQSRAARRALTNAARYRREAAHAEGHERRFLVQRARAAVAIAADRNAEVRFSSAQ